MVLESLILAPEALLNTATVEAKTSKMINLNGTNYFISRNKMKDLLFMTKLHLPIFTTIKPDDKTDEE